MTTEEIKKIVDDERAEQLTALLCRHWEVATQRLDTLALEANQRDKPIREAIRGTVPLIDLVGSVMHSVMVC